MDTIASTAPESTADPSCSDCGREWTYPWDEVHNRERCHSREAESLFRAAIRRHLDDNGEPYWHATNDYATSKLRILGIIEHIYLEEVERRFPHLVDEHSGYGRAHVVYRHFTREGILLYVGYSANVSERQKAHEKSSPWWDESARMEVVRYETRDEAIRAELESIRGENPLWNVQSNPR